MPMTTTDQVRQILMNELGLTREWVRGQCEDIVRQATEAHVDRLLKEGKVERWVREEVERYSARASGMRFDQKSLKEIALKAVAERVSSLVFKEPDPAS